MTVLDHLKATGFDPLLAVSQIGKGTAECDEIETRTFACIPYCDGELMLAVEAAGKVIWTDGVCRSYPAGWSHSDEYRVTIYIPWADVPENLQPDKPVW